METERNRDQEIPKIGQNRGLSGLLHNWWDSHINEHKKDVQVSTESKRLR